MFKKIPHTYVIIFCLIVFAAICTLILPAGEFERVEQTTQSGRVLNQIVPGTFSFTESEPQIWQIMSAFFKGFQKTPGIIAFILILGGAFWILNETDAINMGVQTFLDKSRGLEKYSLFRFIGINNLIIALIRIMFSLFGAVFGMSEETIAFVAIFVPLAISMGYDSITGVCMCFLAAGLGFAGCVLNPFTLGIAQDIAGLKMFSGIEYRIFIWFVMTGAGIAFVLWYANRVKRNPRFSPVHEDDLYWRKSQSKARKKEPVAASKTCKITFWVVALVQIGFCISALAHEILPVDILLFVFTLLYIVLGLISLRKNMQMFALNILFFTIVYLVLGVTGYDWGFTEIAA